MKNPDITTTKATIQALGGKVLADADFQIGFEIAHVRKGSKDIYFTPDEALAYSVKQSLGKNRAANNLTGVTIPAASAGKISSKPAEKSVRLVKIHATKQGALTRRSDR